MEITFKDILDHPQTVNLSQIEYLEKLTEEHPYFQVAHLLLAKKLYQAGKASEFNTYLKKAAIYAGDRKKLYHLIHDAEKANPKESVISLAETPIETPQNHTAQEILNKRLEEISGKKENKQEKENESRIVNTEINIPESKDATSLEKKDVQEKKNIKPGYFSIEELLELPEESKEKNAEIPKTDEPANKEVPISSKLSFKDWLHYYSGGKIVNQANTIKPEDEKPKPQDLIDKFIKEEPRISPARNNFFSPVNMARKSVIEQDDLVSETLANIYYSQGNLHKALQMYEKLSLKYPGKSAFFASQIEKIQNSLKSN